MKSASLALARQTLAAHSKSFALAGKLLPRECRDDAAVVYAWCRRVDDAIDLGPVDGRAQALEQTREELERIYQGRPQADPVLGAFQEVVHRRRIPRCHPGELLEGLRMDVEGRRYETMDDLLLYCFRMAGTVGLMMCHVMGVADRVALRRATDLGIAMQLTNVCRDVAEDWRNGRLYLPRVLLGRGGGPKLQPAVAARAVRALLARADWFYRSGNEGLRALPFRCAVAVRTASLVYRDIGREIARQRHEVGAGRAVVSLPRKIFLALRAMSTEVAVRLRRALLPPRFSATPAPQKADAHGSYQ
jgi:phytoene synthase